MLSNSIIDCYGDQYPSWNQIALSLDKYKLITGINQ